MFGESAEKSIEELGFVSDAVQRQLVWICVLLHVYVYMCVC